MGRKCKQRHLPAGFFDSIGPLRKSLPKFALGNRRESCLTYRSWQLSSGRDREPAQMAWTMVPFTVDGVKLAICKSGKHGGAYSPPCASKSRFVLHQGCAKLTLSVRFADLSYLVPCISVADAVARD